MKGDCLWIICANNKHHVTVGMLLLPLLSCMAFGRIPKGHACLGRPIARPLSGETIKTEITNEPAELTPPPSAPLF